MSNHLKGSLLWRVLVVAAAVSLIVIGLSAFALVTRASASATSASDPVANIAAAESTPTVGLDAADIAELPGTELQQSSSAGRQLVDEAHALPSTIDGQAAYVIPTSSGQVCFFVEHLVEGCGPALDATRPAMFGVADPDGTGGKGPIVFGLAMDGVNSVSFTENGASRHVSVNQNVFEFDGSPDASTDSYANATAIFANNQTVPIP
jgi:hypothetical protein